MDRDSIIHELCENFVTKLFAENKEIGNYGTNNEKKYI